jgi:stage II sporulation protein D
VAGRDIIATMVKSYSSPSFDTVVPTPPNTVRSWDTPTDEELVAAFAAVNAYIAIDELLHIQPARADKSLSPWLVAGRLQSARVSGRANLPLQPSWRKDGPGQKTGLWGSLLSIALMASTALAWAPQAVAQGKSVAAAGSASNSCYNTWSYKNEAQSVRVLLGVPTQKLDLELPDGGSIYSTDGTLVAKVGPRSAWSLNLASAGPRPGGHSVASAQVRRQRLVFAGKSALDIATTRGLPGSGGSIQNTSFVPSGVPSGAPACSPQQAENRFALSSGDGYLVIPDARSTETAVPLVGINGKLYRGSLLLRPAITATGGPDQGVTTLIAVINIVKIEDYLLSVVPAEVPSSWPSEVLKAQAIAARSYVVANLGKHRADGYDVKDSVEDQVYRGVVSESDDTNVACANTAGLVLKQNDQVISAFFHSTSGGSTELAENVWSKPLPYLKSVIDYDDASPLFTWQRSFTVVQLNKLLDFAAPDMSVPSANRSDLAADQISALFIVGRHKNEGQRVKHLIAVGTSSGRVLTGAEVRKLLNLPSTQFSLYQADGAYVFSGRGHGHGLGLSQWGAKALADKGYNAGQILSYYYKDVTIESMGEPVGTNGSI